jgi:drug/metabolite transporter (DMT)-like permease
VLLATAFLSVYFAVQKPHLEKYGALPFTAYAVWAGTLLLLPFLPGLMREASAAPPRATLIAAYLGTSTALAYAAASYVFERLPASQAVTMEYAFPRWPSSSPTSGWG